MSWSLLERFINSDHFNNDPSLSVAYLSYGHIGLQYVLCSKLRRFSYEEIEFFLPQLCHLLVSLENESMALEEFTIDLCEESVNSALLTFWLFQTYLHDFSSNPHSGAFRTCRRIYNKLQRIIIEGADNSRKETIKENALPVMVLCSLTLGSVVAPFLPQHVGPMAIAQARRPRIDDDMIPDGSQIQQPRKSRKPSKISVPAANVPPEQQRRRLSRKEQARSTEDTVKLADRDVIQGENQAAEASAIGLISGLQHSSSGPNQTPSILIDTTKSRLSSSSLPGLANDKASPTPTGALLTPKLFDRVRRRHSQSSKTQARSAISRHQKISLLRSHYFRSVTAFLSALEYISNRLVIVPKAARLSALRAELALVAQDLPAEVDIPVISPATLEDGAAARSVHHRVVRINPAEATTLNSAERVPYLLMVEVLQEDFDFNPDSPSNQELLATLLTKTGIERHRLFDLASATNEHEPTATPLTHSDSVLEPSAGDLGSYSLIKESRATDKSLKAPRTPLPRRSHSSTALSDGNPSQAPIPANPSPRASEPAYSRASSPGPRRLLRSASGKSSGQQDQSEISALATHMRTASQMLTQLNSTTSKRPRAEVAAIQSRIIASMQSLEEQTLNFDDVNATPTFDNIVAKSDEELRIADVDQLEAELEQMPDPTSTSGAGAARMENDQKTGGVQRHGDRDDPSAATFGEEWATKKERVRRLSPYGWMKNWDLVSVIVKTGADLRQEAFASQLIQVCAMIWEDADVSVWVKRMRILVTGESSGLIETITNGVSLHSLKRSLTLANIKAGTNPKRRIATLRDHFIKTFGEPDSEPYQAACDEFARSLAAYSVLSYVLQLKDRHNGNILVDNAGHIIHIDFGFILSNSPGSMGFEAAPFKLTHEYVEVLGGVTSPGYDSYKALCKQAFQALRKDAEKLIMLVEVMGRESKMPCFSATVSQAVSALRARFVQQLSRDEAEVYMDELIQKSLGSYYTRLYDTFQYRTQGIY